MSFLCRLLPRPFRRRTGAKMAAVHMPRNTAPTQATISTLSTPAFKIANDDELTRLNHDQIVFILPAAVTKEPNGDGYLIYSLIETSPESIKADEVEKQQPFQLEVTLASQLPEDLELTQFLLQGANPASGKGSGSRLLPPPHLRSDPHIVVSTRSGIRLAVPFYEGVLRPLLGALGLEQVPDSKTSPKSELSSSGHRYKVTITENEHTIRDFASSHLTKDKARRRTIVLLSGDGGVVDLLNGIGEAQEHHDTDEVPTIGILPLGTGNALFHSLHKLEYGKYPEGKGPSSLVLGLRTLFRGRPERLPTFRAEFSKGSRLIGAPKPIAQDGETDDRNGVENGGLKDVDHLVGAIVASYGFHASLVWESDTPTYRVHGDKRFGMAAGELLKVSHAYDADVEVLLKGEEVFRPLARKGREEEGGKYGYVLAAMVSNLEKTFTISPASKPLEGQLWLVHFGDVGGEKTMEIMQKAYRGGEHIKMEEVGYEVVEEVRVIIKEKDLRWRKVCIDGAIVEIEEGGWMRVGREKGERLRVLVA